MKYYTSSGELVEYKSSTPEFFGTSAEIFKITSTLYLKEYYEETKESARMNHTTFKIFKYLNHPFTNRVIDLLYKEENIKNTPSFLENQNIYQVDAYLYEFLSSKNINFIRQKKEYIFYNLQALEELIVFLFPEVKLIANDLKRENVVFWQDKIILIDLDNCKYSEIESIEEIRKQNKEKMIRLFKSLVMRSKTYSHIYDERVNELFTLETNEPLVTQVERRLKRTKNIEEYLKNKN